MRTTDASKGMGPGRILIAMALIALAASSAAAVTVDLSVVDVPDRHIYADFNYTLTDAQSDAATVLIEYSLNGTEFTELYTLTDKATSPAGTPYTFSWFTLNWGDVKAADVTVWLRMTATDDDGSASDTVGPFPINNQPRAVISEAVVYGPGAQTGEDEYSAVLVRGKAFNIAVKVIVRNPWWFWPEDTLGRVNVGISINGIPVGSAGDDFGGSIEDAERWVSIDDTATPWNGVGPDFPTDFPVAAAYIMTITGSAYRLDCEPLEMPVQILAPDASVHVTSPNGGEVWLLGSTHEITWESDAGGTVQIWLYSGPPESTDDMSNIATDVENDGTYSWEIPADWGRHDDLQIGVFLMADGDISDFSDAAFILADGAPVAIDLLLVDDPDRHIYADFNYTLADAESDPATVLIEYSLNGTDFTELYTLADKATSPAGTPYTFSWFTLNWDDVKAVDSTVWLRMTATDDDGSSSDTVGPFPIYNRPYVDVLSVSVEGPVDGSPLLVRGERVSIGALLRVHNPQWFWPEDTQLELTLYPSINGHYAGFDYGSRPWNYGFEDFEEQVGGQGILPMDLPVSDSYTLTVSGGASRLDWGPVSVPVEVLRADASIRITSPNGGEIWQRGSTHEITWESGLGGSVWIVVQRESGADWVINDSTANDGSIGWTIPTDLPPGDDYTVGIQWKTWGGIWDVSDGPFTVAADTDAPAVSNVAAVPATVREGLDDSVLLTATATDEGGGVAGAEYFVGADGGAGSGTAMAAADGAFGSEVEALTATVDASAWTLGTVTLGVRARDAESNWGAAVTIEVEVVESTPPEAVTDLAAQAVSEPERLPAAVAAVSSEGAGTPASYLVDGDASTAWRTAGTLAAEDEFVTLDLGSVKEIGGVGLVAGQHRRLFPSGFEIETSEDGVDWTTATFEVHVSPAAGEYLWLLADTQARYVRISGAGMSEGGRNGRYYWEIAEASVYAPLSGAFAEVTWTAPADAEEYDLRFSRTAITSESFAAATRADIELSPGAPGATEAVVVDAGTPGGEVFFALKAADGNGNWSQMSNIANADLAMTGAAALAPPDGVTAEAGPPVRFDYAAEGLSPFFIELAPVEPLAGLPLLMRIATPAAAGQCTPNARQWRSLKMLAGPEGQVLWRLNGKSRRFAGVYSPWRSIYFDCGRITGLAIAPSHDAGGVTAVYAADPAPTFSWVNEAVDMPRVYVDVSADEGVTIGNRGRTLIAKRGEGASAWTPSGSEWRWLLRLASKTGGRLYWRVRATDAEGALACVSATKALLIDGGTFNMSALDLSAAQPKVEFMHDGPGAWRYRLEVAVGEEFGGSGGVMSLACKEGERVINLKTQDVRRVEARAVKRGTAAVCYRIRARTADGTFETVSPSASAALP